MVTVVAVVAVVAAVAMVFMVGTESELLGEDFPGSGVGRPGVMIMRKRKMC